MAGFLRKLKSILLDIRLFSSLVIQIPLRGYQLAPANAVIDSCLYRRGLEFLWVFPRQSGKDEAIGQLLTFLLVLFHRVEAAMVHVYPTSQQISTGVTRLENRLNNLWTDGRWWSKSKPTRRGVGLAQCAFFSGHPQSRAEGATANLLLVVNEVQDQHESTVERRFTPMRASTNATAIYVGTVRTTADYLWRTRQRLERLEAQDGVKRVFVVSPDQVGQENRHYAEFVGGQVAKYGREHPIVKTEFFNEPVDVAAGLFPERRRVLMMGTHARLSAPRPGETYLALIDVGGQDEAATAAYAELSNPGRDYTVLTIVRVIRYEQQPHYEVVYVWSDQGTRHFQARPGRPSLFEQLMTEIKRWGPLAVICDVTGVGQGITDALTLRLQGRVWPFDFSKGYGKSRLGNDFLAVIETGRFRYFAGNSTEELSDWWWFFVQVDRCGYELAEGVPLERGLRWGVEPSARVIVGGESLPVHDDRLLSAALVAEADRLIREGLLFLTTGESAVIRERREEGGWR